MTLTADNIMIAVGGRPSIPQIPGGEHCISSDGFFALDKQPKSVAVVGGGYIGVELAGVFKALGTDTHLFTRAAKPLKEFDGMIVDALMAEMKKQELLHIPNQEPASVEKGGDGRLMIKTTTGERFGPYDQVVMAVGRRPLVEPLQLDRAGVKLDKKGFIAVDAFQATSVEGVFALGLLSVPVLLV